METTKRGRGRPPKKIKFDLNIKDANINNNVNNIIPAANIVKQYIPGQKIAEYPIYFVCNNANVWKVLFEVLKCNHSYVIINIDDTGIAICNDENETDVKSISIKLFPDKMVQFSVQKKIILRIDVEEFFKIIKTIPNNTNFAIFLEKSEEDQQYNNLIIKIADKDNNRQKTYSIKLQDAIVNEIPQEKKANIDYAANYEVIAMLNADDFHTDCKNMKTFSDIFEINYSNKCLTFQFATNNMIFHTNEMGESKSLEFIKKPNDQNEIISRRYLLDSFFKYTKCYKFSTIMKPYITKNPELPGIFEYDINPQVGTFQIFISPVAK